LLAASITLAFSLACAKGNPDDGEVDVDYDDDGNPTGDYAEHRAECEAYLDCLAEVAPSQVSSATSEYGSSSVCWETDAEARRCGDACEASREDLFDDHPTVAECAADGVAATLGDLDLEWTAHWVDGGLCEAPTSALDLITES